jgi:hypothetical protein
MNRVRLFAAAIVVGIVALIASYYLLGGPLHISLYFPITQYVGPKYGHIPPPPPSNGPNLGTPVPLPKPSPTKRPHPSMRVPTATDAILKATPRPIMLSPTQAPVTPPPAPSYQAVTPPPFGQTIPPVIMPHAGVPLPGAVSPSPSSSP